MAVPLPLLRDLARHGTAPALIGGDAALTYACLAEEMAAVVDRVGSSRRLVLVAGRNDLTTVVQYLAAVAAGHVVMLVPGEEPARLRQWIHQYDPDVLVGVTGSGSVDVRRHRTVHDLHPDLALLLSTSGSTGSPRLARLSYHGVQANASSIAAFLGIRSTDRAMLHLPLSYSYGLSVLHSNLLAGAAVVITDASVVDPCFWDLADRARITSLHGVPHTFDLLDRIAFADRESPSLRYVTQAGGRLHPDSVARWASLGAERGWDFHVMYGQTEATARMAHLPVDRALTAPDAVGVAIPGGSLRIEPVDGVEDGVGELVYRGPNVMLGYAVRPADLAQGRVIDELRTGDLARIGEDGLVRIVGRRARFAKVLGHRIDLERVESALHADGITAVCTEVEGRLGVLVEASPSHCLDVDDLARRLTPFCGLPAASLLITTTTALPRLGTGKPDLVAVAQCLSRMLTSPAAVMRPAHETDLRAAMATALSVPLDRVTDDATFAGLGGDSLSYVEMSIAVEEITGRLPADWHLTPIAVLESMATESRTGDAAGSRKRSRSPFTRRMHGDHSAGQQSSESSVRVSGPGVHARSWTRVAHVEATVLMRAIAIIAIIGSHMGLFNIRGGAHLLLAVAGYNVARFQLSDIDRGQRARRLLSATARIVVPSVAWLAFAIGVLGWSQYHWGNVLFVQNVIGLDGAEPAWRYWFLEAIAYVLLATAALVAWRRFDSIERRWPWATAMAVLAVTLAIRFDVLGIAPQRQLIYRAAFVAWLFALGWAIQRAQGVRMRVLMTGLSLLLMHDYFTRDARTAFVAIGLVLLIWVRALPVPRVLVPLVGTVAASSLYIYLVHWQVFPGLVRVNGWLALLGSVAVGVAYARGSTWLMRRARVRSGARRADIGVPAAEASHGVEAARSDRGRAVCAEPDASPARSLTP